MIIRDKMDLRLGSFEELLIMLETIYFLEPNSLFKLFELQE